MKSWLNGSKTYFWLNIFYHLKRKCQRQNLCIFVKRYKKFLNRSWFNYLTFIIFTDEIEYTSSIWCSLIDRVVLFEFHLFYRLQEVAIGSIHSNWELKYIIFYYNWQFQRLLLFMLLMALTKAFSYLGASKKAKRRQVQYEYGW